MIGYQAGDVVVMRMWGGWYRDVYVDETNLHNGHPAFVGWIVQDTADGYLVTSKRVWGYDAQIIRNLGPTVFNEQHDRVYAYSN